MTEGKGGISPYNLMVHKIMNQKYKTKKKGKKIVYDIQTALEKNELVKKYYKDKPIELADMLHKVDRAIQEMGWKANHKVVISDEDLWKSEYPLPNVFWEPGKKRKKKGFENLYRMREN